MAKVMYCDLCMIPIKENNFYTLYINNPDNKYPDQSEFDNLKDYYQAYYRYITSIQKEVKEICPSCKHIFDKMFQLRLTRLCELTEEINLTFGLPTKEPPKRKNNGKKKKKK